MSTEGNRLEQKKDPFHVKKWSSSIPFMTELVIFTNDLIHSGAQTLAVRVLENSYTSGIDGNFFSKGKI